MLQFLSALLKIPYEPCRCCEVYREQLRIVNKEKEDLLNTILGFTNPKVVEQAPRVIDPIKPRMMPWRIQKKQLEQEARATSKLKKDNPDVAKEIEELEKELGVNNAEQDKVS